MESESWNPRLSTSSSRRYQFRSDLFSGGHEETDADEASKPEFLCPFCGDVFDIVGLCCHIDEEHSVEAKNGVCPICAKRVGMDIVGHITMQHGSFLKVQRKRKFRKGGSSMTLSVLKKELKEGHLRSLLEGSSCIVPSSIEADPLLSSFIYNLPSVDEPLKVQSHCLVKAGSEQESSKENFSERNGARLTSSGEDQEEKARKCEFLQGLVMSTILDEL